MRYTTLIDISEIPAAYRCVNARLLYLHLCLKAGYHDEDRDICALSIRSLAADCGITVSATRHALKVLAKYSLIEQRDGVIIVKKWVEQKAISKREAAKTVPTVAAEREREQRRADEREAEHKALLRDLKEQGKSSLDAYFDMLEKKAAEGDIEAAETLARRKKQRASIKEQ